MKMTEGELYDNLNGASFSTLVCQKDIPTDKDVVELHGKGYGAAISAKQFSEMLPLLPMDKFFYGPSLTLLSLYFNPETLTAVPVFIPQLLLLPTPEREKKQMLVLEEIERVEKKMCDGDYRPNLQVFPNGMRLEYIEMLSKKIDIPNLYDTFFSTYRSVDFGFSAVSPRFLQQVFAAKTDADKAKTAAALRDLPDEITIFRGGNTLSVPYSQAFSWTTDINVASFFAARQGNGPGYIVRARIGRNDVIDFFPQQRSEREIIVDPASASFSVENIIDVKGLSYLDKMFPIVTPTFHRYREKLYRLDFAQKSREHGIEHEARVLLMCLILAHELKLPKKDVDVLCTAALYHDVRRDNDGVDERHGAMGRAYYEKTVSNPNPIVGFLCEFHCLPDEVGEKAGKEFGEEGVRLLHIFKDADALDRVRFGIQDVDLNQMRLKVSKTMVLVARLCLQHLQV